MTDHIIGSQIHCQQCTAVLPVEQGSQFVTCQYCGTTNFIDKTRAVFHYAVRATIGEQDALAALRRWMAGNDTVKDLDRNAKLNQPTFEYFPMWMIRAKQPEREQVFLEPAAALSVSELKYLTVPAADLEPYDHTLDSAALSPTVPYEAMQQWLADDHQVQAQNIQEVSLVHLPIYRCKYSFKERPYTAVVDAATSKVFANIYPSKWEAPYFLIGVAAFIAYFCAALTPAGGYLVDEGTGLLIGVVVYIVLALILAIPIFAIAAFISAKV